MLAGILAVTGDAGCLLIVKNYTGDRLNFGLAAERAKAMGKRVEMVVVGDDIALPDLPQPRGVAGTLFVHKIAGHLAARGETLDVVAAAAREVASAVRSYGVALDNCTVPGNSKDDRVPAGKAELGLGIHGEPGVQTIDFTDARSVCRQLMAKLGETVIGGEAQIMLLNNLGGATALEMQIVLNALLESSLGEQVTVVVGPAALMTSLDMHGFSVSLLPARAEWINALHAPVGASAWPGCFPVGPVDIQPMPAGWRASAVHEVSHDEFLRRLLSASCAAFMSMQDDLNALDAKTGDGDTGTTLATAADSLSRSIDKLPLADTTALLRAISDQISISMGGSSGVLLAILFSAASDAMRTGSSPAAAIREGVTRMMIYGGAELGDRTMVDALVPALDTLLHSGDVQQAAVAARQGADATRLMTRARSGRSVYCARIGLAGRHRSGRRGRRSIFQRTGYSGQELLIIT